MGVVEGYEVTAIASHHQVSVSTSLSTSAHGVFLTQGIKVTQAFMLPSQKKKKKLWEAVPNQQPLAVGGEITSREVVQS